jgi:hypothetical protein
MYRLGLSISSYGFTLNLGFPHPLPQKVKLAEDYFAGNSAHFLQKCSSVLQLITGFVRDSAETIFPT